MKYPRRVLEVLGDVHYEDELPNPNTYPHHTYHVAVYNDLDCSLDEKRVMHRKRSYIKHKVMLASDVSKAHYYEGYCWFRIIGSNR